MIGKTKFVNNIRGFAQRVIHKLDDLPKRTTQMVFCSGDEDVFEIERRNLDSKNRQEIKTLDAKTSRPKFVSGDSDLKDVRMSSFHRLQLRQSKILTIKNLRLIV